MWIPTYKQQVGSQSVCLRLSPEWKWVQPLSKWLVPEPSYMSMKVCRHDYKVRNERLTLVIFTLVWQLREYYFCDCQHSYKSFLRWATDSVICFRSFHYFLWENWILSSAVRSFFFFFFSISFSLPLTTNVKKVREDILRFSTLCGPRAVEDWGNSPQVWLFTPASSDSSGCPADLHFNRTDLVSTPQGSEHFTFPLKFA